MARNTQDKHNTKTNKQTLTIPTANKPKHKTKQTQPTPTDKYIKTTHITQQQQQQDKTQTQKK